MMPSNDFNRPCLSINTVPVTTSLMTIRSQQSWQKRQDEALCGDTAGAPSQQSVRF
jgi:hypothetical protein